MVNNKFLANSLMNKGKAYGYNGDFPAAITAFKKAIEIAPTLFSPWKALGDFLCTYFRYKDALNLYDRLIQLQPENVEGWVEKASILESIKRYRDADEVYNEALKLHPDSDYLRNRKNENRSHFESRTTQNIIDSKKTLRLGSKTVTITETGEILEIDDS